MKLNLGSGPIELAGFENLTPPAWRFQDGLPYPDGSIEGITISHALQNLPRDAWGAFFREAARVLAPGGVIRITDDNCEASPDNLWHESLAETGPQAVKSYLRLVGLTPLHHSADSTSFRDSSLLQARHGAEPKVFFVEGRMP